MLCRVPFRLHSHRVPRRPVGHQPRVTNGGERNSRTVRGVRTECALQLERDFASTQQLAQLQRALDHMTGRYSLVVEDQPGRVLASRLRFSRQDRQGLTKEALAVWRITITNNAENTAHVYTSALIASDLAEHDVPERVPEVLDISFDWSHYVPFEIGHLDLYDIVEAAGRLVEDRRHQSGYNLNIQIVQRLRIEG